MSQSQNVAVITPENVVALVRMYFESQELKEEASDFTKYMLLWKNKTNMIFNDIVNKNIYDVFWAIRVLNNQDGKYDIDDIEFHARRNPIFAEINPQRDPKEKIPPKQLGILRQAIRSYQAQK